MTDKPPKPGIYRVGLEYPIMLPHAIKNIYDNPRTDIVIRSYVSAEGRNVVLMDGIQGHVHSNLIQTNNTPQYQQS